MHISYQPKGVCAAGLEFDNHKGLAALAEGMPPEEAAKRLKGITCGRRNTSCPDQLAVALEQFLAEQ